MLVNKKPKSNLKKHYFVLLQIGIIGSMLIFIAAFRINMYSENNQDENKQNEQEKQEVIEMEDVVRTRQVDKPPQPPSPQPPVEVPNDEIIENREEVDKLLENIDQQVSSGKKLSVPPPPDQEEEDEKIFTVVERQPQLKGGMDTLRSMINYPEMAHKAGVEGRVYVEFIVNKNGKVENPRVIRGPGAGLNKEALRVIKQAEFTPGLQQGRPVNVKMSMPIIFRIDEGSGT